MEPPKEPQELTPTNMSWMDIIASTSVPAASVPAVPSEPKKRKREAQSESDTESDTESDDASKDDSIVQDDVIEDTENADIPDEDLARKEAEKITAGIESEEHGRSLRPRRNIRPPKDLYVDAVTREIKVLRGSGDKEHEPFFKHFEREVLGEGDGESVSESESEAPTDTDEEYSKESDSESTSSVEMH